MKRRPFTPHHATKPAYSSDGSVVGRGYAALPIAPYLHPLCPWVDTFGDGYFRDDLPPSFPPSLVGQLVEDVGPVCVLCEPVAIDSDFATELGRDDPVFVAPAADAAVAAEAIALGMTAAGINPTPGGSRRPCQKCQQPVSGMTMATTVGHQWHEACWNNAPPAARGTLRRRLELPAECRPPFARLWRQ